MLAKIRNKMSKKDLLAISRTAHDNLLRPVNVLAIPRSTPAPVTSFISPSFPLSTELPLFSADLGTLLRALKPSGGGNLSSGNNSCRHPQEAHSKLRDRTAAFRFCERVAPCTEPISTAGSVMCATSAVTREVTVHDGCQVSWWYSLADRHIRDPTWVVLF